MFSVEIKHFPPNPYKLHKMFFLLECLPTHTPCRFLDQEACTIVHCTVQYSTYTVLAARSKNPQEDCIAKMEQSKRVPYPIKPPANL